MLRFQVCLLLCSGFTATAQPRFAAIFSDHVVLQRDRAIEIWGLGATPGQELEVVLGGSRVPARTMRDGRWSVSFPPKPATQQGSTLELIVNGKRRSLIQDVVFGDVWLAAGQSNMQWPMRQVSKKLPAARVWVDQSHRPLVRMRRINDPVRPESGEKSPDLQPGEWMPMSPKSVLGCSAVAAVYARELRDELKVPIGIIDVSWGGKPIEPFIPPPAFRTPLLQQILHLANAGKLEELSSLPGGVIIRNPQGYPGAIYNARMHPLTPMRIRGFIWYQAESNCGRNEDPRFYREKQRALIEGWREAWRDGDLPCHYVQLPSFADATGWIRMREEQRLALSVPHTGMAVTIDIRGEGIHPPDKLSVGRRLAHIALAKTYQRNFFGAEGPTYDGHTVDGSVIRVRFKHTATGLMVGDKPGVGPPQETPGSRLRWFEIADATGNWHPANASIQGNDVVVSSPNVVAPKAVRYACATEPQGGNLYNRAGYPASPFCSDLDLLPWDDHGE